jgi:hypothetical protein
MENQEKPKTTVWQSRSNFTQTSNDFINIYDTRISIISRSDFKSIIDNLRKEKIENPSIYYDIIKAIPNYKALYEHEGFQVSNTLLSDIHNTRNYNEFKQSENEELEYALIESFKYFFVGETSHTLKILRKLLDPIHEYYNHEEDRLKLPNSMNEYYDNKTYHLLLDYSIQEYEDMCQKIECITRDLYDLGSSDNTSNFDTLKNLIKNVLDFLGNPRYYNNLKIQLDFNKKINELYQISRDNSVQVQLDKAKGELDTKKDAISDYLDKKYDKLSLAIRKQTDMFHYLADGKDSFGKAIQETDNLKKSNQHKSWYCSLSFQFYTWLFVDTHFKNKSQKWLVASMLLVIVPILLLFVWKPASITDFFHVTLPQTASTHVLYLSWLIQVSKRVFFIVLYVYVLQVCIKNYNANRHNQIASKHRANVLETLLLLMDKDKFAEQKESIEKMVVSIVEQKNTGFEKQDVAVLSDLLAVLGKLKH